MQVSNLVLRSIAYATVLALCAAVPTPSDAAERNWQKNPAIVQIDTAVDVFAIGDPHGDPERLIGVLLAAKLIGGAPIDSAQVKWAGGRAVLVVTGDMIDKGSNSIDVIVLLRTLQAQAESQGGRVIVTMGNHEAEFLADPLGKKTKDFRDELKTAGLNPVDIANCGGDIGQFLCGLPIGVRINDWFFSHGGNTNRLSLAQLSDSIQDGFRVDGFGTKELIGDNSILEARLNKKGPGNLPWFQEGKSGANPQKVLAAYAKKLGVRHLVQGHQYGNVRFPDGKGRAESHFFQRYGLLFLIDTGMSQGIEESDSTGGALRIGGTASDRKAVVICANGNEETIWSKNKSDRSQVHCGK